MKVDLHVHTYYSSDSLLSFEANSRHDQKTMGSNRRQELAIASAIDRAAAVTPHDHREPVAFRECSQFSGVIGDEAGGLERRRIQPRMGPAPRVAHLRPAVAA